MKTFHFEQGSDEWHAIRLGIPTASAFDRIIQPVNLKPSKSRTKYLAELLAEIRLGEPLESGDSMWLGRGRMMEDEARAWYEFAHSVDVVQVGFCRADNGAYGGSPDGLVSDDGLVEFKCRNAANHVEIEMRTDKPGAALTQVHGLLWITGRQWCDVVNYNPKLGAVVRRVERDEDYIGALAAAVLGFTNELQAAKDALALQV